MPPPPPDPRSAADRSLVATMAGVMVNASLAAVKGVAGVLGGSYALIADAMESALDIVSSLIVWGGLRIAATPPDKNHPYGHGKAEPLAAIVVAICLHGAALALAIQAIHEIREPQQIPETYTLYVLAAVILVKEGLFRFVVRVGEDVQSAAVKGDAWHHRSDAITSAAAFIGISVAIWGGEGYEAADAWAALFACGVIFYSGVRVIRPALAEVMDTAPPPGVEQAVRDAALGVQGVAGLDACTVRKSGFEYYVDLHVEVDGGITVREGHAIAHAVKDAIQQQLPSVRDALIHIEPADHASLRTH